MAYTSLLAEGSHRYNACECLYRRQCTKLNKVLYYCILVIILHYIIVLYCILYFSECVYVITYWTQCNITTSQTEFNQRWHTVTSRRHSQMHVAAFCYITLHLTFDMFAFYGSVSSWNARW